MIGNDMKAYTAERKTTFVKVNSGLGENGVASAGLGEWRTWEDTSNLRPDVVVSSHFWKRKQPKEIGTG
jgi:hypothetical protein